MIQRARPADPTLDEILSRIFDEMRPRRIILFGSRARGDARRDSDYDVMVELDGQPSGWRDCASRHRLFSVRDWPVHVHVRLRGELEVQRDDPGTVDWDIAREGLVLYVAKGVPEDIVALRPPRVSEPRREPPPSAKGWLVRAERDFALCQHLMTTGIWWETVCFSAQQASEKYLKGLLVQRHIRPPRTHKLADLVDAVRAAGCEMPDLTAECVLLTPFANDARYAVTLQTETEARSAFGAAQRIIEAARRHALGK